MLNGLTLIREALKEVVEDLSQIEEDGDALLYDFWALTEIIEHFLGLKHLKQPRKKEGPRISRQARKDQAAAGASSIKVDSRPDGSATVQIDGGPSVSLPPGPAWLLDVLKADDGADSPDALVPWKSLPMVVEGLKAHTKKIYTKGAIRQLFYRLRREFFKHGENKFLVMSSRKHGYRFALRRGTNIQPISKP